MKQPNLFLYFFTLLCSCFSSAMVDPREDCEQQEVLDVKQQLARFERNRLAAEGARLCNLQMVKDIVDQSNAHVAKDGLSLLSITLRELKFAPPSAYACPHYLISLGAAIDKRAKNEKYSPLAFSVGVAVYEGQIFPLQFLLDRDANPFLPNQTPEGWSAAFLAFKMRYQALQPVQSMSRARVASLFAKRATTIHDAVETYDELLVNKFIAPHSVNHFNQERTTPLLRAIHLNSVEHISDTFMIVRALLQNKADPNLIAMINGVKYTPLDKATLNALDTGNICLIPLLLQAKADPTLDASPREKCDVRSAYGLARFYATGQFSCKSKNEFAIKSKTAQKLLELFDDHLKPDRFAGE